LWWLLEGSLYETPAVARVELGSLWLLGVDKSPTWE
jgi:hypothetical protein